MRAPSPRIPTFDELYRAIVALPEGVTGEILEPGVIRTIARPGRRHRLVAKSLSDQLSEFDRDRGGTGWWIESEAEVRFPNDRLAVPDLTAWRSVDDSAAFLEQNPITRLPDWCCEVLSPTTERDDRRLKLPLYSDQGVSWTWLVDPDSRVVEVYESRDHAPLLAIVARADDVVELPPFGRLDLGRLWQPDR